MSGSSLEKKRGLSLFRGLGGAAGAQEGLDFIGGAGGGEEIALAHAAAGLCEELALGVGLDPFGDDVEAQAAREGDKRLCETGALAVDRHAGDELAVDADGAHAKALKHRER